MNSNLIISPIGDTSLHRTWIAGPEAPNFDLFLIYYGNGPDAAASDAQYYLRRKGFKFELLHAVAEEHSDKLATYDRIWCPDDDLASSTADLNRLFEIFERYQLQLAQPAIAKGDVSYRNLLRRGGNVLRYTPFVEVMCPVFSRDAFFKLKDTFLESRSGWGLDWIWPKFFAPQEMAIIDQVGIHHTRPLCTGEHYQNLARLGIDPMRDFETVTARHGGIDYAVVHLMRRGRMRMKCIADPEDRRSLYERIADQLHWRFRKRKATV